jgi:molecular chaperone IbpA
MRDFDLTPMWRSTIGFDRLFDLIDDSFRLQGQDNYPPYNIARVGEDHYRISLALAGFKPEEITVTAEQNMLTVEGRKVENGDHEYLFQGICGTSVPAPVQPRRLCRGHRRIVGKRSPADRADA